MLRFADNITAVTGDEEYLQKNIDIMEKIFKVTK